MSLKIFDFRNVAHFQHKNIFLTWHLKMKANCSKTQKINNRYDTRIGIRKKKSEIFIIEKNILGNILENIF